MEIRPILFFFLFIVPTVFALPADFVYLKKIDPTILQDMRYAGYHNFIGKPIQGYDASTCILTLPAAAALSKVQAELAKFHLSLQVYDCYRPQQAVQEFIAWSKNSKDQKMKAEFYPNVDKKDFFHLGYVAAKSSHSRGSTVDLTIVKNPLPADLGHYQPGSQLIACNAPYDKRFNDGSIDMGTGFDCMDPRSHSLNRNISKLAYKNRMLLRQIMIKNGFNPYSKEWWHFTLKNEPFPHTYFNFPVAQ